VSAHDQKGKRRNKIRKTKFTIGFSIILLVIFSFLVVDGTNNKKERRKRLWNCQLKLNNFNLFSSFFFLFHSLPLMKKKNRQSRAKGCFSMSGECGCRVTSYPPPVNDTQVNFNKKYKIKSVWLLTGGGEQVTPTIPHCPTPSTKRKRTKGCVFHTPLSCWCWSGKTVWISCRDHFLHSLTLMSLVFYYIKYI